MTTIYLVPIEPITTRYTGDWFNHIPKLLDAVGADVVIVNGDDIPAVPTPGAFLDFGATNIYKSSQMMTICDLFRKGKITSGDKFLFTDAWNPTVIQLKYMSDLMSIPVEIHGLWHAGSYDKHDFLGRLIGDTPWIRNAEASMFYCYDTNWFATRFHSNLFCRELLGVDILFEDDETAEIQETDAKRIQITGWPMEYMEEKLLPYKNLTKKPTIVFPHRIAPEKQLEIFKDLEKELPEYEWIVCQEKKLSKHEYHIVLGESSIVFSASLQETLGIAVAEAAIVNSIPLMPDRLSYSEVFNGYEDLLYPSDWTTSFDNYLKNKTNVINMIKSTMDRRDTIVPKVQDFVKTRMPQFFTADPLVNALMK